ncbi:MAG: small metal-binding protein SmbP [Methylococcales bacterium]|nr:small metal-binding protein SmbP [Methylococcales bacterium]
MNKLTTVLAGLLLCLSTNVFAEQHADAALEHATAAAAQGKAGNAGGLVDHAKMALDEAATASIVSKSITKNRLDEAGEFLQKAVHEGNLSHAPAATKLVNEAIAVLKSIPKK